MSDMSIVQQNILSNFGGNIWVGLMSLVFVPVYIHFIGIEAFGLVGIFVSLIGVFALLDMGLSNTLNREMARLFPQGDNAREMRDLVRTLEVPYWACGLFIGIGIAALAPVIAYHWVNTENLSPPTVRLAIMIMGFAIAFQWPQSLYSGGLMGLQRQGVLNVILSMMATVRGVGAVLTLWLVSPTVEAFFLWQIVVSLTKTGLLALFFWRCLPHDDQAPRFRPRLLVNIWRFATGVTGITILATLLTQLDKIILSRMLSLEMFGYYSLAYIVAITLYRFVGPIFSAVYPKLVNLTALNFNEELIIFYHKGAQLLSVLVLPTAFILVLFSKEVLLLWTRNPVTTEHTYVLVSILVMGTALNGLMNIPYALQLAAGWTSLAFFINLVSVLFLVPLMIVLTNLYGAIGAASVWVILNGGYIIFAIPMMHKRLLPLEKWRWYKEDVGIPFVVSLVTAFSFRFFMPASFKGFYLVLYLAAASFLTLILTAMATPVTRVWMKRQVGVLIKRDTVKI